jgi:hypothetical protein
MDPSSRHPRAADLRRRLAELAAELLKTEDELVALESEGQLKLNAATAPATARAPCTPAEKVALFLDLFGTRRSVYARRWENEKTGYLPACNNEWRPNVCYKPKVKCAECKEPYETEDAS